LRSERKAGSYELSLEIALELQAILAEEQIPKLTPFRQVA
jgi:hypothetical protein